MCCLFLCRHNESHLQQSRKSKECHALSETDVCIKCQETEKKLLAKQKQSEENAKLPLKRNDPLHIMSTEKLQVALKCVRQQEKRLRQKLELLKKIKRERERERDSVSVNPELHRDMETFIKAYKPSDPLARLFWNEQQKALGTKGETGIKWHPMMIRLALLIHSKGRATYNALRNNGVLKLPGLFL